MADKGQSHYRLFAQQPEREESNAPKFLVSSHSFPQSLDIRMRPDDQTEAKRMSKDETRRPEAAGTRGRKRAPGSLE